MEGKGKKFLKKAKYDELVEYDSLPGYLKDNEFILGSYRSEWPLKQAFLSIFSIHNETLNTWTHLIGFFVFLFLTIYTATKETQKPITRWPFFAFLGGTMFCLLASTACHLLACNSARLHYILLRFDYAGISILIATSFYPSIYYTFTCQPVFCYLYLGFITTFAIGTIIFSLLPIFQRPYFWCYRTSLFFAMGISGVVPVIHKMVLYGNHKEALQTSGYEVLMGVLYGIGAFIYVRRVPERWRPGKFDIVCNSHQLFHVLVVAAAYTHYHTGLVYLEWRDMYGCLHMH